MPFEIVRNDITKMQVDAIVNAASRKPQVNAGVNLAVHKKAGPKLLEARQKIGYMHPGQAAITPAFELDAQYVIHAVSPTWKDGTFNEEKLLRDAYNVSLDLALKHDCESVAFPLLAAGNHGFPRRLAIQIAINAFSHFLMNHDMMIYLVVFTKESLALSEKLFHNVSSFIDENYVEEYEELYRLRNSRRRRAMLDIERCESLSEYEDCFEEKKNVQYAPVAASSPLDLNEFLKKKDAGFAETLVDLIERSGKKNSEIYKKANVDKKLFSKIINNVNYHPSKETAISFAIALQLNLEQTQDLIARAGYTLTHSSKFDLIIEYFIRENVYDMFEINEVLFAFDQSPLGC